MVLSAWRMCVWPRPSKHYRPESNGSSADDRSGKPRNAIVFNGEICISSRCAKYERLRRVFRSHSDTEVILALYRRLGGCLQRLRGMFAFALWDEQNRRLFIVRDRVGKKPLNYALVNGGLVFCSEIDPLSRHPAVPREMDMEALELYLSASTFRRRGASTVIFASSPPPLRIAGSQWVQDRAVLGCQIQQQSTRLGTGRSRWLGRKD
ncbi:MAG: hypothetical protein IPJ33_00805 [Gammaproteobacteria bacterium]|nr:hypothetical protein [Gammaproteobacteria bacterium]